MNILGLTYEGSQITDRETFNLLPRQLQEVLSQKNGFIGLNGGIHIRGCVHQPEWHSLYMYWKGSEAFHAVYEAVDEQDIPFGQDCYGEQLILRKDQVFILRTETGEMEPLSSSLQEFWGNLEKNPITYLGLEAFEGLLESEFNLRPGELINVYPPFVIDSPVERTAKAISVEGRLSSLKKLYEEIKEFPDGTSITIKKNTE
ncbi:MAG: hypothetical protein AAGI38_12875 [Bacteroidota bacterium]